MAQINTALKAALKDPPFIQVPRRPGSHRGDPTSTAWSVPATRNS